MRQARQLGHLSEAVDERGGPAHARPEDVGEEHVDAAAVQVAAFADADARQHGQAAHGHRDQHHEHRLLHAGVALRHNAPLPITRCLERPVNIRRN